MQLQEIMSTDFDVISANDFAEEAAEFMRRHNKTSLFVLERESIIGVVLLEELRKVDPRLLKDAAVRDFMSREAFKASPSLSLPEASRLLQGKPNACLFVTWNEKPIGVVTHTDLLRALEVSGNQARVRNQKLTANQAIHHVLKTAT